MGWMLFFEVCSLHILQFVYTSQDGQRKAKADDT